MRSVLLGTLMLLASLQCGCSKPSELADQTPTVEGILEFFESGMAIGGEADPQGYILKGYQWVSGEPAFAYSRIYIDGPVDSSYLRKRVRVVGRPEMISAGGVETRKRTFLRIRAERITLID